MKYLHSAPFSSKAATEDYRANHEATFGAKAKVCAWCKGTGLEEYIPEQPSPTTYALRPCPKGCEAPK